MTTDALETAKEQLGNAAGAIKDATGSGVEGAQELASSISASATEHGADALASSEHLAREGAAAIKEHPRRGFAVAALLLLLFAGLAAAHRARRSR